MLIDNVNYKGENLTGERGKVYVWDEKRAIWAVRLGKNGQVIGVKTERLQKILQIELSMLDSVEFTTLQHGEDKLFNLPQGVEVRINLTTGLKEVRS